MAEYIDLLTDKEEDIMVSNISIGSEDTVIDFDYDDIANALECITINHHEISSRYHNLTKHYCTLKILWQLLKCTSVKLITKYEGKTEGLEPCTFTICVHVL